MHRSQNQTFLLCTLVVALLGSGCVTEVMVETSQKTPEEAAMARRNLGVDHVINGRVAFGIRDLRHAISLNEEDALTNMWLGHAYLLKGRDEDALKHAQRSVELDPGKHEARLVLSSIYIETGMYSDAIAEADVLIEDPTFGSPWRAFNNRGWAQLKLNQLPLARASFEEALEYRPNYWIAVLNLGIIEQAEGDCLGALRFFGEVLEVGPGPGAEAEVHYRMAECYVTLGRLERAIYDLEQAVELTPHGRWGRQSRDYLVMLR
jgi:Tfp pilus assembly protein PilF